MEPGSGGYLWKCQRGDWSRRKEGRLQTRRMNGVETQPWGMTVTPGTASRGDRWSVETSVEQCRVLDGTASYNIL